jgi:hypothetical protein
MLDGDRCLRRLIYRLFCIRNPYRRIAPRRAPAAIVRLRQTRGDERRAQIDGRGGLHPRHDAAGVLAVAHIKQPHLHRFAVGRRQMPGQERPGAFRKRALAGAAAVQLRRIDTREADPRGQVLPEPDAGANLDRVAVHHLDHRGQNRPAQHLYRPGPRRVATSAEQTQREGSHGWSKTAEGP